MAPFLAPLLATLASNGLGLIADAVKAKGKDVVEKALGVNLEESVKSEAGLIELQKLQVQQEKQLQDFALAKGEQELRGTELAHKNTDSARQMNARIQESANAGRLAKTAPYILDFVIVGSTIALAALLFFKAIPLENKELAYTALGSLLTLCVTVVNFHRGSSAGSKANGDSNRAILDALVKKQ